MAWKRGRGKGGGWVDGGWVDGGLGVEGWGDGECIAFGVGEWKFY